MNSIIWAMRKMTYIFNVRGAETPNRANIEVEAFKNTNTRKTFMKK